MRWEYEKLGDDGEIKYLPAHDFEGKITGKIVIGLKLYFDENPGEAARCGWIKHIKRDYKEIRELYPDWNPQTQNIFVTQKQVDEWTIEDEYHFEDKSQQQLALEEMMETMGLYAADRVVQIDDAGGVIAGW